MSHVVVFVDRGWGLVHPGECGLDLESCPHRQTALETLDQLGDTGLRGRYLYLLVEEENGEPT